MRTIERSRQFKCDYKREKKGPHAKSLDAGLIAVIGRLGADEPLEPRYRDHPLSASGAITAIATSSQTWC